MKIKELRDMTVQELQTRRRDLKQEQFHLRMQQQAGQLEKSSQLTSLRRDVARIESILSERRLKTSKDAAAATTAVPSGVSPGAPAKANTTATHVVVSRGLLLQLVKTMPRWADGLLGQLVSLRQAMSGVPAAWDWLVRTAANDTSRWYLLQVAFRLGLILALAGLGWFAMRRLLSPRRGRRLHA